MVDKIKNPIIIISTGRGGSTIFHKLLAEHPDLAWMSTTVRRWPKKPHLNRYVMHAIDLPLIGKWIKTKLSPQEVYDFWDENCRGFSSTYRDLRAADVTNKSKIQVNRSLRKTMTSNRSRLLLKITGWPRIEYLNELFEDPYFIYLSRDPKAVANSQLNVYFWNGWQGPSNWIWGPLENKYQKIWEFHNESYIALAAIQIKILNDRVQECRNSVKNFLEISYEDLCYNRQNEIEKVCEFVGIEYADNFKKRLSRYTMRNSNNKWKEDLTEEQQNVLEKIFHGAAAADVAPNSPNC